MVTGGVEIPGNDFTGGFAEVPVGNFTPLPTPIPEPVPFPIVPPGKTIFPPVELFLPPTLIPEPVPDLPELVFPVEPLPPP